MNWRERDSRLRRFELALQQSNPQYMQQLMLAEDCCDEDELGDRYFALRNIDADACRYDNPFYGRIDKGMIDSLYPEPEVIEKVRYVKVPVEKIVEKIVEKKVEVPVEKIVEKEVKVIDPMDEQKLSALMGIRSELSSLNMRVSSIDGTVNENVPQLSALQSVKELSALKDIQQLSILNDIAQQMALIQSAQYCTYAKLSNIDKNVASMKFPDVSKELSKIIDNLSSMIGDVPMIGFVPESKRMKGMRTITYVG